MPQSVKDAIGRRLNRLQETTLNILHTAAAIGKQFPFRELAMVSTASEDALLDALDEASAAQLVRANADDSFTFTHDKIREVLYKELNPVRRRRLHQRIGESFVRLYGETGNGHVQDIAYHFAQSGDLEKSLTYNLRAADSAARVFAHDDGLRFLEQARESADALNLPVMLAQIDARRGDMYRARGLTFEAIANYERALQGTTDMQARGTLDAQIGEAFASVGDPRGQDYLHRALTELDAESNPLSYALVLAHLGRYFHYRTEHTRSLEFLRQALTLAKGAPNNSTTLTGIYTYLAGAYQHILDYDQSDEWARASIALGEKHDLPLAIALGYEFLAENDFGRGRWRAALDYAERGHTIAERIGALDRVAWSDFGRAMAQYGMGDLAAARAAALEGLDLAERIGEGRLATWIDPLLALVAADLGEQETAQQLAARSLARAEELGQIVLLSWALHAMGYTYLRGGEATRAAAIYTRYLDLVSPSENQVARSLIMATAAEALFRAGETERATRVAEETLALAARGKTLHYLALAQRVRAQIHLAQREWDLAQTLLDRAIQTFQEIGSQIELGRALVTRAGLWDAHGETERAAADRAQAEAIFARCGVKQSHPA